MRVFCVLILLLCSTNSFSKLIDWEYSDLSGSIISKGKIRYGSPQDEFEQWNIDGHDLIQASWSLDNVKTTSGFLIPGFENVHVYMISITLETVEWGVNFRSVGGLNGWNQAGVGLVPKEEYITANDPLGAAFDAGWAPFVWIFGTDYRETLGKIKFHSVKVTEPATLALVLIGLSVLSVSRVAARKQPIALKR